jgi:hypothetical protein
VHSELKDELSRDNQQLARERQLHAQLDRQLQAALGTAGAPTVTLNLLQQGTLRGEANVINEAHSPQLKVGAAGRIHTEVALPPGATGAFAVQVLCAGNMVWSHGPVDSRAVPGGALLSFEFPAQVLAEGNCRLALRHVNESEISYLFSVSKLQ